MKQGGGQGGGIIYDIERARARRAHIHTEAHTYIRECVHAMGSFPTLSRGRCCVTLQPLARWLRREEGREKPGTRDSATEFISGSDVTGAGT